MARLARSTTRDAAAAQKDLARSGSGNLVGRPGSSRHDEGAERRRLMRARGSAGLAAVVVTVIALTAGCGGHGSPGASGASSRSPGPGGAGSPAAACGTTKTAANVPVQVDVSRGTVTCAVAMTIERDYAKAVRSGGAPGNGGGGPVTIDGWTCQGFATPVVLRTGQASKCVHGAAEILAILPLPA
jgi:hypothetical protein